MQERVLYTLLMQDVSMISWEYSHDQVVDRLKMDMWEELTAVAVRWDDLPLVGGDINVVCFRWTGR